MEETGKTIAKNASYLMFSQVATWILTLLLTIILARYLGSERTGKFHLANSLWAMVAVLATFGMDTLLTKEIARRVDKVAVFFSVSAVLRLIIFLFGAAIIVVYARLVGYPQETLQIIYIIGIANLVGQVGGTCSACLQGLEEMKYVSLGTIAAKFVLTVLNIALVLLGMGIVAIAIVDIVAAIASLAIQYYYLNRYERLHFYFEWEMARWMLKESSPYLLVALFLVVYQQVDMVIISLFVNEAAVGWYGASDKLFGTLLFVPTVFITAVFPAISRMYVDDPEALPRLMGKSFNLLLVIGVAIGLGIFLVADQVVLILFGTDFVNSGPILAVTGFIIIFTYQNILLGRYLIAIDRQKNWVWVMAIATIATIPLDILLIPLCQRLFNNGAIGGAVTYLITEFAMFLIGLKLMPAGMLGKQTAQIALRIVLAGVLMVTAVWQIRHLFIAIPITAGAIVYLIGIFLFRAISAEDLALFQSIGQSVLNRLRNRGQKSV